MATVREATFHLLRCLGMTTVFGNPAQRSCLSSKTSPETSATCSGSRRRRC